MNYIIKQKLPGAFEWQKLRAAVGWHTYSNEDASIAIEKSLYGISIYNNEVLIAMARVIGDGKTCFYIQDVIVSPDYRGKGLGSLMMDDVLLFIKNNKAPGAIVALMSAVGRESFYERFGFIKRPNEALGHGMILPKEFL